MFSFQSRLQYQESLKEFQSGLQVKHSWVLTFKFFRSMTWAPILRLRTLSTGVWLSKNLLSPGSLSHAANFFSSPSHLASSLLLIRVTSSVCVQSLVGTIPFSPTLLFLVLASISASLSLQSPCKPYDYNTSLWLVSWVGSDLWLVDCLPSSVLWECWPGSGLTVSSPASTQCWSEHISANTKSQMQTFSLHHPKIDQ